MVVYGVALLALCLLLGTYLGNVLGYLMGIDANVGGVGIAMLMLIVLSNLSHSKFHLKPMTESGIHFWSAMYIPIVVAMAAKQNVVAALSSGWLAVIAGVGAVVVSFALVPVLTKLGGSDAAPLTDKES
ncbi:MAG: malonate transporter subunit MadL [Porticoccaceae bacterium]|nr:malonate transporter subunit MadL [Porticoccaceae bacterium]